MIITDLDVDSNWPAYWWDWNIYKNHLADFIIGDFKHIETTFYTVFALAQHKPISTACLYTFIWVCTYMCRVRLPLLNRYLIPNLPSFHREKYAKGNCPSLGDQASRTRENSTRGCKGNNILWYNTL